MRFHSLPAQVADYLKSEIARGRWVDSLPGERALAETLRVSRRTLTAALVQLRKAGAIRSEAGRGHRIAAASPDHAAKPRRQIGLLTPTVLDSMRPGTALWINDVRALLAAAGFRFNHYSGPKYFSRHPGQALAKLVRSNPQDCWILAGSAEPTQRWFAREKVPAVVGGTCHGDVVLPDVDLDFFALGRHAAGRIAAHRHRKAALFLTQAPGYLTSESQTEKGFREVLERSGIEAVAVYHERSRDGLVRVLRRLFGGREHPTALVMTNSLDYLTAISFLTQRGLRVPADVSVVARNDDAFMTALLPEPTRYHASPHVLAQRFFKLAMQIAAGETPLRPHVRLMPDFIAGESLGRAPDRAVATAPAQAGS
jgi:DNA-binding LacI/PurR family transcriptional regulator